jgi:RNA polymerase sigma factor (sigma-70 family)
VFIDGKGRTENELKMIVRNPMEESTEESGCPVRKHIVMYWNDPYFIYDPFERILIEELIGRVMDVLTEKQKVVFLEHCIYGKKQSQIADEMGVSRANISRMIGRARRNIIAAGIFTEQNINLKGKLKNERPEAQRI